MIFPDAPTAHTFADSSVPTLEDFAPYTLAWAIQFYLEDMSAMKRPVGESQAYAMRAIQRREIGSMLVPKMEEDDILEYGKGRIHKDEVKPATVTHDLSDIRVCLKHCKSARKDCKNFGTAIVAIDDALPLMAKYQLVGKSVPRTRRTLQQEFDALKTLFLTPSKKGHARVIPMAEIMEFAIRSARRLGEICRITWGDVDFERKVYIVRDVKHPTKKKGNDKEFALFPPVAEIILRQPREGTDPKERIFKARSRSVTSAYCNAKDKLGIVNLHFHDLRAEAISRWLLILKSADLVRKLVSGHETDKQINSTYDRRSTVEIMDQVSHLFGDFSRLAAPPSVEEIAAGVEPTFFQRADEFIEKKAAT